MRRSAFTLIEVLVVISIVVVLIALLFPAIGSIRRAAHATICQSNLRSHYIGLQSYQDANNGVMPMTVVPFRPDLGYDTPVMELAIQLGVSMPRIDRGQIAAGQPWLCPSDQEALQQWGWSYFYWAESFFSYHRIDGNAAGRVTAYYNNNPSEPVFIDSYPGHARNSTIQQGRPNGHARFMVRYNGSIDRFKAYLD